MNTLREEIEMLCRTYRSKCASAEADTVFSQNLLHDMAYQLGRLVIANEELFVAAPKLKAACEFALNEAEERKVGTLSFEAITKLRAALGDK